MKLDEDTQHALDEIERMAGDPKLRREVGCGLLGHALAVRRGLLATVAELDRLEAAIMEGDPR